MSARPKIMDIKDEIVTLVLEYAAKCLHVGVVNVLYEDQTRTPLQDVLLSAITVYKVISLQDVDRYELAVTILEQLYEHEPTCCPFKKVSRLLLGIKMKMLLERLRKYDGQILSEINKQLPQKGFSFTTQDKKALNEMNMKAKEFRKFILPLVVNFEGRMEYFETQYGEEFGDGYGRSLTALLEKVLSQMLSYLPPCALEVLLSKAKEAPQCLKNSPGGKIVLGFIKGRKTLDGDSLMKLLKLLNDHDQLPESARMKLLSCVGYEEEKENTLDNSNDYRIKFLNQSFSPMKNSLNIDHDKVLVEKLDHRTLSVKKNRKPTGCHSKKQKHEADDLSSCAETDVTRNSYLKNINAQEQRNAFNEVAGSKNSSPTDMCDHENSKIRNECTDSKSCHKIGMNKMNVKTFHTKNRDSSTTLLKKGKKYKGKKPTLKRSKRLTYTKAKESHKSPRHLKQDCVNKKAQSHKYWFYTPVYPVNSEEDNSEISYRETRRKSAICTKNKEHTEKSVHKSSFEFSNVDFALFSEKSAKSTFENSKVSEDENIRNESTASESCRKIGMNNLNVKTIHPKHKDCSITFMKKCKNHKGKTHKGKMHKGKKPTLKRSKRLTNTKTKVCYKSPQHLKQDCVNKKAKSHKYWFYTPVYPGVNEEDTSEISSRETRKKSAASTKDIGETEKNVPKSSFEFSNVDLALFSEKSAKSTLEFNSIGNDKLLENDVEKRKINLWCKTGSKSRHLRSTSNIEPKSFYGKSVSESYRSYKKSKEKSVSRENVLRNVRKKVKQGLASVSNTRLSRARCQAKNTSHRNTTVVKSTRTLRKRKPTNCKENDRKDNSNICDTISSSEVGEMSPLIKVQRWQEINAKYFVSEQDRICEHLFKGPQRDGFVELGTSESGRKCCTNSNIATNYKTLEKDKSILMNGIRNLNEENQSTGVTEKCLYRLDRLDREIDLHGTNIGDIQEHDVMVDEGSIVEPSVRSEQHENLDLDMLLDEEPMFEDSRPIREVPDLSVFLS